MNSLGLKVLKWKFSVILGAQCWNKQIDYDDVPFSAIQNGRQLAF